MRRRGFLGGLVASVAAAVTARGRSAAAAPVPPSAPAGPEAAPAGPDDAAPAKALPRWIGHS
jgi:hypothetical protein